MLISDILVFAGVRFYGLAMYVVYLDMDGYGAMRFNMRIPLKISTMKWVALRPL